MNVNDLNWTHQRIHLLCINFIHTRDATHKTIQTLSSYTAILRFIKTYIHTNNTAVYSSLSDFLVLSDEVATMICCLAFEQQTKLNFFLEFQIRVEISSSFWCLFLIFNEVSPWLLFIPQILLCYNEQQS